MKAIRGVVLAAILFQIPSAAPSPAAPSRLRVASPPRLVLFLSVDQMRFDYLTRFRPLFEGGLKTLVTRGAVFTKALYGHASSETGPGHAAMASGRHGRHSGIIANEWWDAAARREVNVVDDPRQKTVGGLGRAASPANFDGFTVGDVLKRASPASRVVGVAMKDRSAVLMAGPRADAAYWFDSNTGAFVTSTYYTKTLPPWLAAFNARRPADAYRKWERSRPDEALYRRYAGEDDVRGEWDNVDTKFPHVIRGVPPQPAFYDDFRRTPFADELVLQVALQALDAHALGADEAPDILAVGFSATDPIGHTYGPDSQEVMDQVLRLDGFLGTLLQAVEERVGAGRTLVVLTADHGVMPLVENLRAKGIDAHRASPRLFESAVRGALLERFPGAGELVAHFDGPSLWLDLERLRARGLSRAAIEAEATRAILATGLIDKVYTHEQLKGPPPAGDPHFTLVREAFFPARSPHLFAVVRPNVYVGGRSGGTGHGTVYEYDRHVPVVFMGPKVAPGTHDAPCGPESIAPTLGAMLGLDYPLQAAPRRLDEILAR